MTFVVVFHEGLTNQVLDSEEREGICIGSASCASVMSECMCVRHECICNFRVRSCISVRVCSCACVRAGVRACVGAWVRACVVFVGAGVRACVRRALGRVLVRTVLWTGPGDHHVFANLGHGPRDAKGTVAVRRSEPLLCLPPLLRGPAFGPVDR